MRWAWDGTVLASCGVGEAMRDINSMKVLPAKPWLPSCGFPQGGAGVPECVSWELSPGPCWHVFCVAAERKQRRAVGTSLQPLHPHHPPSTAPSSCRSLKPQWCEAPQRQTQVQVLTPPVTSRSLTCSQLIFLICKVGRTN